MLTEVTTLMDFERGELPLKEIVEMIAGMVESGEIDNMPRKFEKLANTYIKEGAIDEEGNVNYIKLKEME